MKLLHNGPILTMRHDRAEARALAYDPDNGRIVAVGDEASTRAAVCQAAAGAAVEELDLAGKAVVPGFIDAHHHLCLNLLYGAAVDCSPAKVSTVEQIAERMSRAAGTTEPGQWVLGKQYDEWRLQSRAHPTRQLLDAACPDHPALLMHYSFHEGVANSAALAALGIDRHTPDPPAGRIVRGAGGEPTGRLLETAVSVVEARAQASLLEQDRPGYIARLGPYEEALLAAGITRLADPSVSPTFERMYQQLHRRGQLRLPLMMMPVGQGGFLTAPLDRMQQDRRTGEGPEQLRVGPLKLFFDGGAQAAVALTPSQLARATAAVLRAALRGRSMTPLYAVRRSSMRLGRDLRFHTGVSFYDNDADAGEMVRQAVSHDWSVAIHAVGNVAVDRATAALAASRHRHRVSPPPRIEHATLLDDQLIARLADAEITVAAQPHFISIFEGDGIPPTPGLKRVAIGSLLRAGVHVAGSSDSPVTPFEPLIAMGCAVNRRVGAGPQIDPDEAISVEQALALYTREAARACGCSDHCGTLEPGKRADLVLLSADPRTDDLASLRVEQTILGGETVFSSANHNG